MVLPGAVIYILSAFLFLFFLSFFLNPAGAASEMIILHKCGIHHLGNSCISQHPKPIEEPCLSPFAALPFHVFALNTLAVKNHSA